MIDKSTDDRFAGFDSELKAWGQRPAATDPARAARRVLAALPARPEHHRGLQLAAAVALIVTLALAVFLGTPHTPVQLDRTAQADAPAHLDERVVQFWIDPQTPVYFVLSPMGSPNGGNS
jgi:hypothetical protein